MIRAAVRSRTIFKTMGGLGSGKGFVFPNFFVQNLRTTGFLKDYGMKGLSANTKRENISF